MNEHYITLELHKILEMLVGECSNEASRALAAQIEPSRDVEIVRNEVSKTFDAYSASAKIGSPTFFNFADVASIANRAQSGAQLSLRELLDVSKMLTQTEALISWRRQLEGDFKLDSLLECLFDNRRLNDSITNAVLSEEEISDNASPELASIRRKIAGAGVRIRESLDRIIKSDAKDYLQDSFVAMRDGRYVLPVKAEHRNSVAGLVHDTSASGQTYFIEPLAVWRWSRPTTRSPF